MFRIIFCVFLCSLVDARGYTKKLTVRNGKRWGSWTYLDFCPFKSYAIGFVKKVERDLGRGDDTALNGIRLICGYKSGNPDGSHASSQVGPWGRWTDEVRCNKGHFISAFSLKVEPNQNLGDDTAANNMKIMCRGFDDARGIYDRIRPNRREYGSYGAWSDSCNPKSAVCGIRTNIERPIGRGDDTALNDLELYCCN